MHAASLIQLKKDISRRKLEKLGAFAPEYEGLLVLKQNKKSAQKIGEILRGEVYLGANASEDIFRQDAENYEALHLAVHGYADIESPINAYLDFGKSTKENYDGQLFAYELYSLSLNSKIVSLIACEAGYGKLEKGEGVMSLARAFRLAGAHTIMTSLWKADGRAAAPISENFYVQLRSGLKPSKALQQSKISFLEQAKPEMTHPYFWAGYVITGKDEIIWPSFFQSYGLWILLSISFLLILLYFQIKNKKIKLT